MNAKSTIRSEVITLKRARQSATIIAPTIYRESAEGPVPMQGPMQPTVYRFTFGGFEIAAILDGKVVRDRLHPAFGAERSAAEAGALCAENASGRRALTGRGGDVSRRFRPLPCRPQERAGPLRLAR